MLSKGLDRSMMASFSLHRRVQPDNSTVIYSGYFKSDALSGFQFRLGQSTEHVAHTRTPLAAK